MTSDCIINILLEDVEKRIDETFVVDVVLGYQSSYNYS
jgi:hypothetical protein